MTAPSIEQAKAICEIRDRLWKYTRKSFRRLRGEPRGPQELLQHLTKIHEKLMKAKGEAARPITEQEIEKRRKGRDRLNAEFLSKRTRCLDANHQQWPTDDKSIIKAIQEQRRAVTENLCRDMEPDISASMPLYEMHYQRQHWLRLAGAGLVHDGMICSPEDALRFLEAKPNWRTGDIPSTLKDIVAQERLVRERLRLQAKDAGAQDLWKHPSVARLHRAAWRVAPADARAKVERYLSFFGKKRPSADSIFVLLEQYITEGPQALDEQIEAMKRSREEHLEACSKMARENEENKQARIAEIEALRRMTPQEREAARQKRKRSRFAKRAEMIEQSISRGVVPTSRQRCLFCGRGLQDPVSALYGVGPDCRDFIVTAIGEQQALRFLELLKVQRGKESRHE